MKRKNKKEQDYRVVVLGNIPLDMANRVSKIHALALLKAESIDFRRKPSLSGILHYANPSEEVNKLYKDIIKRRNIFSNINCE